MTSGNYDGFDEDLASETYPVDLHSVVLHADGHEFAEALLNRPMRYGAPKSESSWNMIWLGKCAQGDERSTGTSEGVVRTKDVKRRLPKRSSALLGPQQTSLPPPRFTTARQQGNAAWRLPRWAAG